MSTNKPQFNVYLEPEIRDEIDRYCQKAGVKKNRLIENMWAFYQLRDLTVLYNKLAAHIARGLTDREKGALYQIYTLLHKQFGHVEKEINQ